MLPRRRSGAVRVCPRVPNSSLWSQVCRSEWMRLAVLKERRASETRVAATPDTVKRLVALGVTVAIETGAGAQAAIPDHEFAAAGATIAPDPAEPLAGAGIVFAVQMPLPEQRTQIP